MQVFVKLAGHRYEQLVFCHDKATGLRAIIAVHDTTLGPALGATVNDASIPKLRCRIIAGSANNVLPEARHGGALAERGILYSPTA